MHKRIVGIPFILSFCILRFISQTNYYALSALIVLPVIASVHVFGLCKLHKLKLKHSIILFIIALLCSGFLKKFLLPLVESRIFVQSYVRSTGPSMEPTVPEKSRVVVDKFTYIWKNPVIGDIVSFYPPDNDYSDHLDLKCKRIVALGGETIQILKEDIYIDGEKREVMLHKRRQVYSESSTPINFLGKDNPFLAYGVQEPYHIPEGHYFVLGDNLSYSIDSRCFGAVPRENITGKVIKISWPHRRMGVVR